jgi:hypothetical protein
MMGDEWCRDSDCYRFSEKRKKNVTRLYVEGRKN